MKLSIVLILLCSIVSFSNAKNNNKKYIKCESDFMYDSCPVGSYSVVETERYVRGRHNWMKVGDTLDTDIITNGVGAEKHRNLRRDEYQFPTSSSYESPIYFEDQHPRVVKSNCDTPQECKI